MPEFNPIEDTLFVPLLGRIYAGEHFPQILKDKKALELKRKLPKTIKGQDTQTQYTLMAGAVRSANMDRHITDFLRRNPEGIIVELGCGLETAFYRNDNGKTQWYEVDLPDVIEYREHLLGKQERDKTIVADALGNEWIKQIRAAHPDTPILVTASGLLCYFEQSKVFHLFRMLKAYKQVEFVFDTVNASGMKRIGKYMKQVGHADAAMYFYVDSGEKLAQQVGATLLAEEPYYAHTDKKGLSFVTATTMKVSDRFRMVKLIHLSLKSEAAHEE